MDDEKQKSRETADYYINTAPEMDALERAASDGKHGRNYTTDELMDGALARRHVIPGASHFVELSLSPEEVLAGLTAKTLEQFTNDQDADAALAFLYISHVLAAPNTGIVQERAGGIIEFDDVLEKIGWDPRSSAERRAMHKRIYQFIRFGERAQVIGKRRGAYKDKHTGELIDTNVRTPLWRILTDETPDQKSLFPETEVPVRVELVMGRQWTQLLTMPQTAQYLPMGEVLGAIPGNKPSGAWARVIGLALASLWRRNPRESIESSIKPSRRELLERYPPKTGPVNDVLSANNPRRAIDYWCDALRILRDCEFLADEGEVKISAKEMSERLPRKNWAELWLCETVEIRPGPLVLPAIKGRAIALPEKKVAPKKRRKKEVE